MISLRDFKFGSVPYTSICLFFPVGTESVQVTEPNLRTCNDSAGLHLFDYFPKKSKSAQSLKVLKFGSVGRFFDGTCGTEFRFPL